MTFSHLPFELKTVQEKMNAKWQCLFAPDPASSLIKRGPPLCESFSAPRLSLIRSLIQIYPKLPPKKIHNYTQRPLEQQSRGCGTLLLAVAHLLDQPWKLIGDPRGRSIRKIYKNSRQGVKFSAIFLTPRSNISSP